MAWGYGRMHKTRQRRYMGDTTYVHSVVLSRDIRHGSYHRRVSGNDDNLAVPVGRSPQPHQHTAQPSPCTCHQAMVNSRPFIQRRVASFTDSKAISRQSAPLTKRYGSSGDSTMCFSNTQRASLYGGLFVGASKIFLAGCHRYLGTPALPAQELDFVNYKHCCPAFIYWVAN
jgi:hypothetical protein